MASVLAVALVALASCDLKSATEMVGCALQDEKLAVAFRDPKRAKQYLRELRGRLQDREPGAITEAVALIDSIASCI